MYLTGGHGLAGGRYAPRVAQRCASTPSRREGVTPTATSLGILASLTSAGILVYDETEAEMAGTAATLKNEIEGVVGIACGTRQKKTEATTVTDPPPPFKVRPPRPLRFRFRSYQPMGGGRCAHPALSPN